MRHAYGFEHNPGCRSRRICQTSEPGRELLDVLCRVPPLPAVRNSVDAVAVIMSGKGTNCRSQIAY